MRLAHYRLSVSLAHSLALIFCNNPWRAGWHRYRAADWWGGVSAETPRQASHRRMAG